MRPLPVIAILFAGASLLSCNKDVKDFITLYFDVNADAGLPRLDATGEEAVLPEGHVAVSPLQVRDIAVQYIELVPTEATPYKGGELVFKAPETYITGSLAIDFDSLLTGTAGSTVFTVNLRKLSPGTYTYARVGIAYLSYDIPLNISGLPGAEYLTDQQATFASFLGFNTYIREVQINQLTKVINDAKTGGYWVLETALEPPLDGENALFTWQVPQESLTVVNILSGTSPVPPGQSVITGAFDEPLVVSEEEERDLRITFTLSVNGIFEFNDENSNGAWDLHADNIYESEPIIDFGIRGLRPSFVFE